MGNTAVIQEPTRPTIDRISRMPPRRERVRGGVASGTGGPVESVAFADVLDAANAGESWAWHHLHMSYSRRVRAYARAQGAPEPDDLTSEVFLRVFSHLSTFAGDEPQFRSWLFTISHHQLIDDARRRRRRPLTTSTPAAPERVIAGDVEHDAMARVGGSGCAISLPPCLTRNAR
jgi:hypothetical protein